MDIQSSTLNSLFVLVPVIIQGWVSPVKPGDLAHGGIPWSIYDEQPKGLECLIDPWTEQKARGATLVVDDRVDLYLNNDANAVTGHTVKKGEEQQRILLYVPKGRLIHGVNRLHYTVKRAGGNIGENSRDLFVLYHLRPANTLDLVIPPKNITSGIGPVDGVQGVEFGFTYNNRRAFDSILFLLGDTFVSFDVPAAPAPITCKLFTDTFEKAGDNPRAVTEFLVIDQLGNVVKSPAKSLDIHIDRLDLPAATVKGQTGNNFTPTQQDVKVLLPPGTLLPTDNMYVTWKGAISTPAASFTSPKRLVSAGLEVVVPRSVLAYSLSKVVEVIYFIERNGVSTTSKPLLLNILPLPVTALIPPKILEADANNVLDVTALGASNATIHALLFTLIEDYQPCWLSVEGKKSDGTAHKLDLWKGLPSRVNPTWVKQGFWPQALANTFLKQLGDGTLLTIKFKVSMNKSNVEATAQVFPDRVYTIRAVALVVPTLEKVLAGTTEVLEGESTVSTSLKISGRASAHGEVEAFQGRGTTAVSLGKATADKSGYWERTIALQLGAKRVYVKSLYHPSADVFSNVRNFNVVANSVPQLLLITDTAGVEILHNGTTTGASIIVSGVGPPNTTLDLVNGGAFIPGGAEIQVNGRGIWTFELENLVVATYNLRARRKDGPVSNARNVIVVAATAPTITSIKGSPSNVEIPHGSTTVENSATLSGVAAKGLKVDVLLGIVSKGQPTADPVTGIWTLLVSGLTVALHSFTAKALYAPGAVSAARTFSVTAATAPTITSIKGSPSNVEIPHGSTTVENSATLSGVAAKGLKVDLLLGTASQGQPVADPTTGIWTHRVTGLGAALHSFTAKALYAPGAVSAARTFTVIADIAPTITSLKGFPSNVEIPNGGITFETSVTLTGTAAKGQKVNVLLGTASQGQPVANPTTGIWTQRVTGLGAALHSFTAKALYGSGRISIPRTCRIQIPYTSPIITRCTNKETGANIPNGSTQGVIRVTYWVTCYAHSKQRSISMRGTYSPGGNWGPITYSIQPNQTSFDTANLGGWPAINHTVTAWCVDEASGLSSNTWVIHHRLS